MTAVGFIGVGTIAAAMARGLRRNTSDISMLLSPRSEAMSLALAEELTDIQRATSNSAVVEGSSIVILTMRPPQLAEALDGLSFRPDQLVLSCLANTSLDHIAAAVAPARAVRMLPLPMIERGEGPLVVYPSDPDVLRLFGDLGDVVAVQNESEFRAFGAASATMSTFFALQASIIRWIAAHGADPRNAETYIRSMQQALSVTAAIRQGGLDELITEHETAGGVNERIRATLEREGWFARIGATLDNVLQVAATDLNPGWQAAPSRRSDG